MFSIPITQTGGRRPTVVLLHSSASSARQWDALAQMLEPAFQVHAVEFHGHGAQPAWPGERPLTLADDAALAAPMLYEAGGAHIVGHSYGGAVALKLATTHPHLVRSLIAYEPMLFRWLDGDGPWDLRRREFLSCGESTGRLLQQGDEAGAAQRFVDFWSGAGTWASLPGRQQSAIAGRMPAVHAHFVALINEPARRREIGQLPMPMLFLMGAQTVPVARRISALLRRALPSSEHQVLDGMGHMGPITHAEAVDLRIMWFLLSRTGAGVDVQPIRKAA